MLEVASGRVGAAGGGGTVGGIEAVVAEARVAIERVTRLVCADCSGVAVDCDDAIGWVGADDIDEDEVADGTGGAVERVICLVGTHCSSSSLLLKYSMGDSTTGLTGG